MLRKLFHRKPLQPDSRAVSIVLGVTGHRDLRTEDLPRLRQAVVDMLDTFARQSRHTPLVLLSALAQGADQLCAEVALQKGLQVIAPLPFPAAVYRQSSSFDNDAARRQFDALLDDPRVTAFVVPLPEAETPPDEAGWIALLETSAGRHRCYANAGGYVVLHCHALLALWDGEENTQAAGTAQIVLFKRTGRPPEAYPWTQPLLHWTDSGPVYVVHTPRASTPATPVPAAGSLTVLYPYRPHAEAAEAAQSTPTAAQQKREKRQFTTMCRSINRINLWLRTNPPPAAEDAVASLLGQDLHPVPEGLRQLAMLRAAAGTLARRRSAWAVRLNVVVFALIFLAALSFHLYAHPLQGTTDQSSHQPPLLWAFLGLLLVAYVTVKVVDFRRLERQALDARALAEALRVQVYWAAAGLGESVAAHYLQQVRSEMSWIRQAVRACSLGVHACSTAFAQLSADDQIARLRTVGQRWLEGQRDYYHRRHTAYHRSHHWCRYGGLTLAILGWLLALALVAGDFLAVGQAQAPAAADTATPPATHAAPAPPQPATAVPDNHAAASGPHGWSALQPPHWLLVLSGTLAVAGGLLIAYGERRAFEELARQYNRMAVLYEHGIDALQTCLERGNVASSQRVLTEMGREALTENASWLILRRARRVELPVH